MARKINLQACIYQQVYVDHNRLYEIAQLTGATAINTAIWSTSPVTCDGLQYVRGE